MSAHKGASSGGTIDGEGVSGRIASWSDTNELSSSANFTINANNQVAIGTAAGLVDGGISGESTFVVGRNTESTYSIIEAYNDQAARWGEFRAYNSNSGAQMSMKTNGSTMSGSFGGSADDSTNMISCVGRLKMGTTGGFAVELIAVNIKRFELTSAGRALWYTRVQQAKGADVASGGTVTLGEDGNVFAITGTTACDYMTTTGWQAGSVVVLMFGTSVTINHNTGTVPGSTAPFLLSGAANFSATANDSLTLCYDGTSWREIGRTVI